MRAVIETWLLRHWYGTHRPPLLLRMLEPIYHAVFQYSQRKRQSSMAHRRSGLPVIVVGNITVGGSGKTPLVIRLCQLAREMNFRPGIVSTGYGRQSAATLAVGPNGDPVTCGDEPVLLAIRTGSPVVVAQRRADAIEKLSDMSVDLVIADDGLQQADLDRDMEICVIDGARGLGNGHLLPAGPLREPGGRLGQVDYVITNGVWVGKPDSVDAIVMELKAGKLCSLDNAVKMMTEEFRQANYGNAVHAIAGIGNPKRFVLTLDALGIEAIPHAFPDHHSYSRKDFNSITPDSAIIMTEKDAVKCRLLGLENAWYLPVVTHLPDHFENTFKTHLAKLMEKRR
ncbi:MAG TPA: tetraacyldisaccharide 4'-kinase [Xanthomonadales bacterium]